MTRYSGFFVRLILAFAFCLCAGRGALAHAFLDNADPAVGATLQSPPQSVRIRFTEALEPAFTKITVLDASGQAVDRGDGHIGAGNPKEYTVGLGALKPGKYKVVWQAVSVDTHKTTGTYDFTVLQ